MKALISPNENNRIAQVEQVEQVEFEIAEPLFWVDCPNEVVADLWTYVEGQFIAPLEPEPADEPTNN